MFPSPFGWWFVLQCNKVKLIVRYLSGTTYICLHSSGYRRNLPVIRTYGRSKGRSLHFLLFNHTCTSSRRTGSREPKSGRSQTTRWSPTRLTTSSRTRRGLPGFCIGGGVCGACAIAADGRALLGGSLLLVGYVYVGFKTKEKRVK